VYSHRPSSLWTSTLRTLLSTCVNFYILVFKYMCICICINEIHVYMYMYKCMYLWMCLSVYIGECVRVRVCVCVCVRVCVCVCVCVCIHRPSSNSTSACTMGWLRLVGSLKLQVSFVEYHLFYRALWQKRPIILRSLLVDVCSHYPHCRCHMCICTYIHVCVHLNMYVTVSVCV